MTDIQQTARPPIARYMAIARALQAYRNCIASGNTEWQDRHETRITTLCNALPSGAGFDSGCCLLISQSTPEKLIFEADFHHMDQHGGYDGWSTHTVIVTGSLAFGFNLHITGRDRNEIKDYISECFGTVLGEMIDEYPGE